MRGWVSSEEEASFLSSFLSSFGGEGGLAGGFSEGAFSEGALSEGAFSEGAFSEDAFSEDALLEGTFPDDATLDLSEWAFFDDAALDLSEGAFSEPATLDVSEGAFSEDAFLDPFELPEPPEPHDILELPDPFELATEAAFSDDGGEGGSFVSLPDFPLFLECPEPASEGAFSGSAAGFFSSVAAFSTAGGGAAPFSFFPLSCFPLGPGAGAGGLSAAGAPGSGPFWNFISISGLPSILGREVEERASTLAWVSFLGVSFLGPLPPDIFSSTEATVGALAEPSLLVRIRMKLWEPWWDPGPEWEPW